MPKRTREDEAGPSTPKLPPLMGMDDTAGSASWGRKNKQGKAKKEKSTTSEDKDAHDDVDVDVGDEETNGDDEDRSVRPSSKKKKTTIAAGVVYISRLPPGMTPDKVRHLMSRWAEVGRVYAQRRDGEYGLREHGRSLQSF